MIYIITGWYIIKTHVYKIHSSKITSILKKSHIKYNDSKRGYYTYSSQKEKVTLNTDTTMTFTK